MMILNTFPMRISSPSQHPHTIPHPLTPPTNPLTLANPSHPPTHISQHQQNHKYHSQQVRFLQTFISSPPPSPSPSLPSILHSRAKLNNIIQTLWSNTLQQTGIQLCQILILHHIQQAQNLHAQLQPLPHITAPNSTPPTTHHPLPTQTHTS